MVALTGADEIFIVRKYIRLTCRRNYLCFQLTVLDRTLCHQSTDRVSYVQRNISKCKPPYIKASAETIRHSKIKKPADGRSIESKV